MIAAYTFESAEDLTEFCARHDIAGSDTFAVVQSLQSGVIDGCPYADLRLTLVLDMNSADLERIREREEAHRESLIRAEQERGRRIAAEEEQWRRQAERERRRREQADVAGPDIPF